MSATSCGAPDQALVVPGGGDVPKGATVIDGLVHSGGEGAGGVYVRLLDETGEFVAEVVSGPVGQFRFHAAPGLWTVRALTTGARGARTIEAVLGRNEVDVPLAAYDESTANA